MAALAGSGNVNLTNAGGYPVNLNVGSNGATTTYSGLLSGSGALAVMGGNLTLTNSTNSFSGGLSITNATLSTGPAATFAYLGSTAGTTNLNNGTLVYNGPSYNPAAAYNLIFNGNSTLVVSNSSAYLEFAGAAFNPDGSGGTLNIAGPGIPIFHSSNSPATFGINVASQATLGTLSWRFSNAEWLTVQPSGQLLWQNNNGPGSIEDLILNGGTGNVGGGFNGGGINGTITLNGTGPANPPGINGNLGAVLDVPYSPVEGGGETIEAPIYLQTTSSFVVGQGTLAGTSCELLVTGNINGPGGLTKDWVSNVPAVRESQSTDWLNSQGTLALYGNNTYSGSTAIYSGTILLGSSTALPGTTVLSIDGSNGSTLDLGGYNASVAGLYNGPNGGGTITNNGAGAVTTLTVSGAGNFSGVIQDGTVRTALAIASTGVFTLGGTNSNTGGVTVSQGTLQLASANAAPQSIVNVNGNSELTFNTNNGSITTFNVAGLGGSGSAVLADSSGAYFTLSVGGNNASSALNGQLSGNGGLIKSGNGTLNLGGALSYTGSTTVSGGLLNVNGIDSASAITVYTGASLGGSGSVPSASVAGGGAIQAGSNGLGELTIGALTFNSTGASNPASIDVANITNYAATPALDVTGNNGLTVSGGSSVTIALSGPAPTGSGKIESLAVRRFDPGPQRLRSVYLEYDRTDRAQRPNRFLIEQRRRLPRLELVRRLPRMARQQQRLLGHEHYRQLGPRVQRCAHDLRTGRCGSL